MMKCGDVFLVPIQIVCYHKHGIKIWKVTTGWHMDKFRVIMKQSQGKSDGGKRAMLQNVFLLSSKIVSCLLIGGPVLDPSSIHVQMPLMPYNHWDNFKIFICLLIIYSDILNWSWSLRMKGLITYYRYKEILPWFTNFQQACVLNVVFWQWWIPTFM